MQCAELGRNPAQLFADYLAGGRTPSFSQADGRSIVFTHSGRSAILLAARLWNISSADEVLVPSYNCGSEISPLIATGARVSMYRVDGNAQIDLSDLRRRITARTRLIHVIHYFGRVTELSELATLCRDRNIMLLEDCALSLFSGNTGRTGDAAVFSFYKTLPTCAGGALVLRSPPSAISGLKTVDRRQTAREALSLTKKWARGTLSAIFPRARRQPRLPDETRDRNFSPLPDIPASYYCAPAAVVQRGPRLIRGVIRRSDAAQIASVRRDNYEMLRRRLLQVKNVSLLWTAPLDLETCPLGLPLLVQDKPLWCRSLNASGIPVSPWWSGYHRGLDWSEFPEAQSLKAQLILLPVHQNLDARHMEYVAGVVRALATKTAISSEKPTARPAENLDLLTAHRD